MRTVIYLDVLLLVNFVVGAAFLLAAGLLCGACCSPLRLVGGAGAAAVSSLALLAPTAPWPLALTYKGTSAALCVAAAYGWQGARNTARLTAWFVLLNLTLTGALFLPGAACNNLSFYLPVLHVLGRSGPACFGAELSVAGRVVPLSVFCDTGFHVQEPLSGRAVVLVRLDAVPLPAGVRAYLDACLAGVGAEPVRPSRDTVCCPPCLPRLGQTVENMMEYTQRFAICRLRRGDGRLSSARKRRRCWVNDNTVGGIHLCFNNL